MYLPEVEQHSDENQQSEPGVELSCEVNNGHQDVDYGGSNVEDDVTEETVDGTRAPVHDSQHLAGLSREVPTQAQPMEMSEHLNSNLSESNLASLNSF